MPKETFYNLPEDKRERFIEAALEEFSDKDFRHASITALVKRLGIAKGSVYQYFDDKLDLWRYLKQHCEQTKLAMAESLNRDDFSDFWGYLRELYKKGIAFDLRYPLCSRFIYHITYKETSPEVQPYLHDWREQASAYFQPIIKQQQEKGTLNNNVRPEIATQFMISISLNLVAILKQTYGVDFDRNIKEGKPVYAGEKEELMEAVDQLIELYKNGLQS